MSEYTSFPLSWPLSWKRTTFRTHSRFGRRNPPTVAQGRDGVIDELRKMKVWDWEVIISTNIPLRRDGLPYSNQKEPSDPGVAVYFKVNKKPTVLACDKWNTVGDNLWAIAKHIEALRGQDRWGVGSLEQAFAGYVALEEKTQASCWEILGIPQSMNGSINENIVMDAYRRKARETHPDTGGTAEAFAEVVRAKDVALQLLK